jgi:PilZ domain
MTTDRRTGNRRTRDLVPEPLTRRRERRGDERRDSPRREIALDVREAGRPSRACQGDLSVGGASFIAAQSPSSDTVELMFSLPTYVGPVVASAVVVGRREHEKGTLVNVVFTDLEVEAELAIAQWFDETHAGASGAQQLATFV